MISIKGIEAQYDLKIRKRIGILLFSEFPSTIVYSDFEEQPIIKEWIDCSNHNVNRYFSYKTTREILRNFLRSNISHRDLVLGCTDGLLYFEDVVNKESQNKFIIAVTQLPIEYLPNADFYFEIEDGVNTKEIIEHFKLDSISNSIEVRTITNQLIPEKSFYETLTKMRNDNDALKECIEETVFKLESSDTSLKKPGIILGKVQSGKTRTFLGVIALAFDRGYDIAIILTKGTKPLTEQTLKRLHEDFGQFEEDNMVQVHDIMTFPKNMAPYELNQKLIIVAKKETHNLNRVLSTLTTTYPDLKHKKILIIDDEADFASISFHKVKESGAIEQGKIAQKIDNIRTEVERSDYLQVTATPYSLYLQPNDEDGENGLFPPKRPEFTVLVPIHKYYVGGDYYFIESQQEGTTASYVYQEVPQDELEILKAIKSLKRADRRSFKLEEVLTSESTKTIRTSIMNFIVGGSIRRIQQQSSGQKQENYSFVIHTEQSRPSHTWQEAVVNKFNEELSNIARNNQTLLSQLVKNAYQNLKPSIDLSRILLPDFDSVLQNVLNALLEGMLVVEKVNSDKDVKALLDSKGQLKLRTPLNIFIGGKILDRGITIKNLIGFYYGRNPKKFQQDTVLQHSRMYGARSKEDLAVTRFYTTQRIYDVMRSIHEFDNALRDAFLTGTNERVYFLRKDNKDRLVPCSPNKIMLSKVTTLRPYKRLLPVGFQTGYKGKIKKYIQDLDKRILKNENQEAGHFIIDLNWSLSILDEISKTLIFEEGYSWDIKAHKASLEHLSKNSDNVSQRGKIWVVFRSKSNIRRKKGDGRFADDVGSGTGETALVEARKLAQDIPALILVRQTGEKEWRSPFWWPVIIAPRKTHTTIFSSDVLKL